MLNWVVLIDVHIPLLSILTVGLLVFSIDLDKKIFGIACTTQLDLTGVGA